MNFTHKCISYQSKFVSYFINFILITTIKSFYFIKVNKMSSNNGILPNGILRPKLLNNSYASCFFINLVFLPLLTAHFDDNNAILFLVFNNFEFTFSVFFALHTICQHVL